MSEIKVGAVREERILVTTDVTIDFLGMEGARVLSTPHMIGFMERACRDLVLGFLEPGYDTVGTHVDVRHLAAAPVGVSVVFRAEIVAVDGRKVHFRMEAADDQEKIGEGLHERTVINVQKFATRLAAKMGAR
jgi:fluoroacetyl-CoA thioesterase